MQDDEVKAMLELVLKNISELSIESRAAHKVSIDTYGEFVKQRGEMSRINKTLFGENDKGGGLVDRVGNLEKFGTALSPWLARFVVAALIIIGLASLCVIALTLLAVRNAFPSISLWP